MLKNLIASNSLSLDLHPFGTDKGTIHSYIEELYIPIFDSGENFGVIYEIGVWHGASLVAWKLLFPHARVVAYDIEKRELHPVALRLLENQQITINYDDAYSDSVIGLVKEKIDLLIDDGPHTIKSQIDSLKWLDKLSEKGTLVIEDIVGGIVGIRKI
ncbi:MAG: class I SAM-dependent methyltransferase, partial [Actinomycetota bacterium]